MFLVFLGFLGFRVFGVFGVFGFGVVGVILGIGLEGFRLFSWDFWELAS